MDGLALMSTTNANTDPLLNGPAANEDLPTQPPSNQDRNPNLPSIEKLEEMKTVITELVSICAYSVICGPRYAVKKHTH